MNEPQSSTRSGDWLTVSQAAAALGISERQARRYAGRLDEDDRREGSHEAGHQSGARPALVRLQAVRAMRENATGHAQTKPGPDTGPDVQKAEAGREPDALTGALVSQLQSENVFLRAQVEAANRQAAEATAALREYLKMQAKALPAPADEPTSSSTRIVVEESAQNGAAAAKSEPTTKETLGAESGAQRGARGEGLRDLRAILKRMFGLQ